MKAALVLVYSVAVGSFLAVVGTWLHVLAAFGN